MNNKILTEEFNLTNEMLEQFNTYYQLLISENEKINLTSITEIEDVYIKHFYDSLLLTKEKDISKISTMIDVGTGAGFPGIPVKIMYPHLQLTLVEPTGKRCLFLEKVVKELHLENVKIVNDRAENCIKDMREMYELATARAVSQLNILSEIVIPFIKKDGLFISMKGSNYSEELENAVNAIKNLGAKIEKISSYELPKDRGKRVFITLKKVKNTPLIYPRIYSKIKKQPL